MSTVVILTRVLQFSFSGSEENPPGAEMLLGNGVTYTNASHTFLWGDPQFLCSAEFFSASSR